MMKIKLITVMVGSLALSGCASLFQKVPPFPDVPAELTQSCSSLKTIDTPEVKLSELMKTVSANYSQYHACATLVDGWNEWYARQKKAREDLGK